MNSELSVPQLTALIKKAAGVTLDPSDLADRIDVAFTDLGLDSLGLLGIVGELENSHGRALPTDAEKCRTPREFLDLVNHSLMAGA
ncbi:phosphopantetheine-binding protein [Streptomyces sp. NPDC002004]